MSSRRAAKPSSKAKSKSFVNGFTCSNASLSMVVRRTCCPTKSRNCATSSSERNRMMLTQDLLIATSALLGLVVLAAAALKGWQGWLALKDRELQHYRPARE